MQYSNKDYEFLGKQVAAGHYVGRTTFFLSLILVLLVGLCLGRYVLPYGESISAADKRPLGAPGQGAGLSSAISGNKDLLPSILEHEEQVRTEPTNVEAWEHLGHLYFDANEPGKAVVAYNKALELKPNNPDILVDCGTMYRSLEQYDKAVEYYQKAIALNPKHENAHFNAGIVLYHDLGRKQEALDLWKALIRINPKAQAPTGIPVAQMIDEHSKE